MHKFVLAMEEEEYHILNFLVFEIWKISVLDFLFYVYVIKKYNLS